MTAGMEITEQIDMKPERNSILWSAAKILIIAIITGYVLQILVYFIPTALMRQQVTESAQILQDMGQYPTDPISGRVIDNYADSITILLASYDGDESAFEKAANSYYKALEDKTPLQSLSGIALSGSEGKRVHYARYWHGSMIFMKPLLLFFNVGQMRNISMVFMILWIIILAALMTRRLPQALAPFAIMMAFIAPTAAGQCFEYAFAVHIMLVAGILYLWNPKGLISGQRIYLLFLLTGIAVAYFDFMTAPVITMAVPLALVCMKEKRPWKSLVLCAAFWFFGYAGMWGGKWIIALISLKGEFLRSFTSHVELWAGSDLPHEAGQVSRIGTVYRNFGRMFEDKYALAALLCYLVLVLIHTVRKWKQISAEQINRSLSLYLPGLAGIVWIMALASHASVHTFFTYRSLAPCVLCFLCGLDLGDITKRKPADENTHRLGRG